MFGVTMSQDLLRVSHWQNFGGQWLFVWRAATPDDDCQWLDDENKVGWCDLECGILHPTVPNELPLLTHVVEEWRRGNIDTLSAPAFGFGVEAETAVRTMNPASYERWIAERRR